MKTLIAFRPSRGVPLLLLAALLAVPALAVVSGQPFWTAFFARILIYAVAASALMTRYSRSTACAEGSSLAAGPGLVRIT